MGGGIYAPRRLSEGILRSTKIPQRLKKLLRKAVKSLEPDGIYGLLMLGRTGLRGSSFAVDGPAFPDGSLSRLALPLALRRAVRRPHAHEDMLATAGAVDPVTGRHQSIAV